MPVPALQREFRKWFAEQTFAVPVTLGPRTRRSLTMSFPSLASQTLYPYLDETEISVAVEWEGYFYDLIFCNDLVRPEKVAGGWGCLHCRTMPADPAAPQRLYPSREALWRDHLFEPFAKWVNEELAPATSLVLCGERDEMTWAYLLPSAAHREDGTGCLILPLQEESAGCRQG